MFVGHWELFEIVLFYKYDSPGAKPDVSFKNQNKRPFLIVRVLFFYITHQESWVTLS